MMRSRDPDRENLGLSSYHFKLKFLKQPGVWQVVCARYIIVLWYANYYQDNLHALLNNCLPSLQLSRELWCPGCPQT